MKNKRAARCLATVLMLPALALGAFAGSFEQSFTDVCEDAWYYDSVESVCETGLMQGTKEHIFSPDSPLIVAEGITIASRIAALQSGETIPEVEGEWYQQYVDYALQKGLLEESTFIDCNAPIRRHEMASLLAETCEALPVINEVEHIADISPVAAYEKAVLSLYRAGVAVGNDSYGNFTPESTLTRAEAAAIVSRVMDSERRIKTTFEPLMVKSYTEGYALIDNPTGIGRTNNSIANGWKYDNRFEMSNTSGWPKKYVTDGSDSAFTALIRDFGKESEGLLTLEMMLELWSKDGGLYIAYENENEEQVVGLQERNGKWLLLGKEEVLTDVEVPRSLTLVSFLVQVDLNQGEMNVSIDNRYVGTVCFPKNAELTRLVLGTNETGSGSVNISHTKLYKNYVVLDRFPAVDRVIGEIPLHYVVQGELSLQKMDVGEDMDMYSVRMVGESGETASAYRAFAPIAGQVDVKTHLLLPGGDDGASFSLMAAGSEVLTLRTENGYFYVGNKKLKSFTKNIWQDLRVEINTETGKALIRINSQTVETDMAFNAAYIDGVKYTFTPQMDAVMWFDDLEIQCREEQDDYVPEPVVAKSDYRIGMYSCYLWRDAVSGEGWDSVSSFPEFEPILGYYDEGLRESADWEIKQMVEHGVDFVEMCWYSPKTSVTQPIKRTGISHEAIHDGFLTAKYSDLMEYCILWETSYGGAVDFEQFKEYIWNYWKDHYFSDDRYLVIDNKLVIFTWSGPTALTELVGKDNMKKALAELDTDVMDSLGYDGVLWLSANLLTTDTVTKELVDSGFAGAGGRWIGAASNNASEQIRYIDINEMYAKEYDTSYLPCISPGYNDIGRSNTRTPMIGAAEHLKVCEYVKSLIDSRHSDSALDNMLIIDSWNEYSEGHSSAPTVENGYMYLDNIRKVFTNEPEEHEALDIAPTDAQKARITHLYPKNYAPLRWFMFEGSDNGIQNTRDPYVTNGANAVAVVTWDMGTPEGTAAWDAGHGLTHYSEENGVISATASGDSSIVLKNVPRISLDEAGILHIHISSTVNDTAQLYFATEESSELGESKKVTFEVSAGEKDYYVELRAHDAWKGQLAGLRIDVLNSPGSFEVSCIELMRSKYDEEHPAPQLFVDEVAHTLVFLPVETADGDYEIAAEATIRGFFSSLRLYHEWDRFTGNGVLTVKTRDKKTFVFRVGSDTVTVDGEEKALGYIFKLRDGLPVFHIKKFCELIGYAYTEDETGIHIHVSSDEELALKEMSAHGNWDYTKLTEVGDWKPRQASLSVTDRYLNIIPTGTDASISTTVNWKAEDYTHALIGLRNTEGAENWIVNLFFATDTTPLGASTCIVQKVETEGCEKDAVLELKLDMTSNIHWNGTITSLRFDPHWTLDPVYIQYIRFIKDEENASFAGGKEPENTVPEEFPLLQDVELELQPSDMVHPKYGLLLAETDFLAEGTPTYLNESYMNDWTVSVFGAKTVGYTDAKSIGRPGGDIVLDVVPVGTAAHRLNYAFDVRQLQKGKYTVTTAVYIPQSNSDTAIFRMDMLDTGVNESSVVNQSKGSWKTYEWSLEVLSYNDKQVLLSDGKVKRAVNFEDIESVNLWIIKSSASTEEHLYFDDVRLYYDPGTLGTDPDYTEAQQEQAVIVYDEECALYFDEPEIYDEENGVLLGEVSFDHSYQMGSELHGTRYPVVKASYVNGNYLGGFSLQFVTNGETAVTDGAETVSKADSFILSLSPQGTEAHRIAIGMQSLLLEPGIYTCTWDVFVPQQSANYSTFRLDILGEGENAAADMTARKGSWVTQKKTFTVKPGQKGMVVVEDAKTSKEMKNTALEALNLWLVKTSSNETDRYYFDNFRLYFQPA